MTWLKASTLSHWQSDRTLLWILRLLATIAAAILILVMIFLVTESWPVLRHITLGRFFSDASWHPSEGLYSLLPMLVATLLTASGAIVLAAPAGLASALFCTYYAPPFVARVYRRLIELLAGIPSVIFGFWGLVVLVPLIARWQQPGASLLAGILILALMILPTLALLTEATLQAVPPQYLQGAAALGFGRSATLLRVVLPAARSGLLTAVLLAIARAIGETMAVLMVCGNVVQLPANLFAPVRTLTANIALEMAYAMGDHRAALFVSGLLLMVLIITLVSLVEVLGRGRLHA